jgi:hypothetical protein
MWMLSAGTTENASRSELSSSRIVVDLAVGWMTYCTVILEGIAKNRKWRHTAEFQTWLNSGVIEFSRPSFSRPSSVSRKLIAEY